MILPLSSEMKVGWRELGWDDDKYFAAYKACIDAYADTIPKKQLAMSFSRPGDTAPVAFRILRYARELLGGRFTAMKNSLSGTSDYSVDPTILIRAGFTSNLLQPFVTTARSEIPSVSSNSLIEPSTNNRNSGQARSPLGGAERMGSPDREIANLEQCRARYVEVYLADLLGGPTTDAYRLWANKGNTP